MSLLFGGAIKATRPEKPDPQKPNIIFLLADDMRFDALGSMFDGLQTPNIDKLAEQGVTFTRAYATTAICMASRAQIMTGLYEFSTGCNFDHGDMAYETWGNSYPVLLRKNGYVTGFEGKFGFKVQNKDGSKGKAATVKKDGFDWWSGWMGQGSYQMNENKEAEAYIEKYGDKPEHTTRALGIMGSEFIREYANKEKPFCLSVSFKAPHTPYHTDPRYDDVCNDKKFKKPGNYGLKNGEHIPAQAKSGRPFSKGKTWVKDYDGTMAKYHHMVYGMDYAIGMMIDELEKQGITNNTIIIFISDNGHHNGTKGLGGKLYAYEEGSRIPMIYVDPRLPKRKRTQTISALAANIDIAPTILDLADVKQPTGMQGKSLLNLIKNSKTENHESLMLINAWGISSAQSLGVVTTNWKYIYWLYGTDGFTPAEELYDMSNDRLEMTNLAQNSAHSTTLKKMHELYDGWIETWKNETVSRNGYPKYVQLGDRSIPFSQHPQSLIDDMYKDKKKGKIKDKRKKDKRKKEKDKTTR